MFRVPIADHLYISGDACLQCPLDPVMNCDRRICSAWCFWPRLSHLYMTSLMRFDDRLCSLFVAHAPGPRPVVGTNPANESSQRRLRGDCFSLPRCVSVPSPDPSWTQALGNPAPSSSCSVFHIPHCRSPRQLLSVPSFL